MKKIILISLVILSVIITVFLLFDSSNQPSTNNEGLRKPDVAANKTSALVLSFKLNKHTFYVQF
jgi:hypothetical protein